MRLIQLIITMGFFTSLFGCNKTPKPSLEDKPISSTASFVSKSDYEQNRSKQMSMTPQTIEQLRGLGVTATSELKLEYFFYTNSKENAEALNSKLSELGYDSEHQTAAGDESLFVVTGWTTPMLMSNDVVIAWSGKMCDHGYEFDCEFDGWGTNPSQ